MNLNPTVSRHGALVASAWREVFLLATSTSSKSRRSYDNKE